MKITLFILVGLVISAETSNGKNYSFVVLESI